MLKSHLSILEVLKSRFSWFYFRKKNIKTVTRLVPLEDTLFHLVTSGTNEEITGSRLWFIYTHLLVKCALRHSVDLPFKSMLGTRGVVSFHFHVATYGPACWRHQYFSCNVHTCFGLFRITSPVLIGCQVCFLLVSFVEARNSLSISLALPRSCHSTISLFAGLIWKPFLWISNTS